MASTTQPSARVDPTAGTGSGTGAGTGQTASDRLAGSLNTLPPATQPSGLHAGSSTTQPAGFGTGELTK